LHRRFRQLQDRQHVIDGCDDWQALGVGRRCRKPRSWIISLGEPPFLLFVSQPRGVFLPGSFEFGVEGTLADTGAVADDIANPLDFVIVEIAGEHEPHEQVGEAV